MSEEELAPLQRQVQRERTARKEAERLLEEKSLALYRANQQLQRDITERKKQEVRIINLNRALRTLSACNLALVHAQTEEELFRNVCRHIVETGGHQLAWVEYSGEAKGGGGDTSATRPPTAVTPSWL